MTYTEIDESQFVPGGEISISAFGQVVHDDFEDLNTRVFANEGAISNLANTATALADKGRWYWNNGGNAEPAIGTRTDVIYDAAVSPNGGILKVGMATETVPNNISYSSSTGLFTCLNSGTYSISFSVELVRKDTGAAALIGGWIGDATLRRSFPFLPVGAGQGQVAPFSGSAQAVQITAGGTFGVYLLATAGQYCLHEPLTRSTNVGVQRTG
jgi:hypothetical protein